MISVHDARRSYISIPGLAKTPLTIDKHSPGTAETYEELTDTGRLANKTKFGGGMCDTGKSDVVKSKSRARVTSDDPFTGLPPYYQAFTEIEFRVFHVGRSRYPQIRSRKK